MSASIAPRALTADEAALLRVIISALDDDGAATLAAQVKATTVSGGIPTMLDLAVAPGAIRATLADGPLPIQVVAPLGQILVWVSGGLLAALEYAWTSDDAPTEMPSPDSVHVAP